PIGPGEILFTEQFYEDCKKCLTEGGVLVTQNGVPMVQASELSNSYRRLRNHFADVTCYLAPVPTYFGGHMAFGWATDDPEKRRTTADEIERRYERTVLETRYYNAAVHAAAFALPNYISRLLDDRSAREASHATASASEPTT
ncbi:MAG: polyamine aminopropyltransferase, partial [Alphaproteobacteria bacterium]